MLNTISCLDHHQVLELLEGRLSESEEASIESHLSLCSACRELLDQVTSDVPASSTTPLGSTVKRTHHFEILKELGSGGMGVVFEAFDNRLERSVAIKRLLPRLAQEAAQVARFLQEARAAAKIRHENVVTIFQVGEDNEGPFLVQELLCGETLEHRLQREKKIDEKLALSLFRQVLCGLSAAHKIGVLHRDIKPSNIWLEQDTDRVKILDFGLAKQMDDPRHQTSSGFILGTPAYMAPEQVDGRKIGPCTDLFSAGVVLYRMLSGAMPFPGKNTIEILQKLALGQPSPLNERDPNSSVRLGQFVHQLIATDPSHRPASAEHALELLTSIAEKGPLAASQVSKRSLGLVSMALALSLGIGCGWLFFRYSSSSDTTAAGLATPSQSAIQLEANPSQKPVPTTEPDQDNSFSDFLARMNRFDVKFFCWSDKQKVSIDIVQTPLRAEAIVALECYGNSSLQDDDFEGVEKLTGLRTIRLENCPKITSEVLQRLRCQQTLDFIWIRGTGIDAQVFPFFAECIKLRSFGIHFDVGPKGKTIRLTEAKQIASIGTLRDLNLENVRMTPDVAEVLWYGLRRLESLRLYSCFPVQQNERPILDAIGNLRNLRELACIGPMFTSRMAENLKSIQNLESLKIASPIEAETIDHLVQAKDLLRMLTLSGWHSIDQPRESSLSRLSDANQLTDLVLDHWWTPRDEELESLSKMPKLKRLVLEADEKSQQWSNEGLLRFMLARPEILVQINGKLQVLPDSP